MEIRYKNNKIKTVCTNLSVCDKKYGIEMSNKIHLRLEEISISNSVEAMIQLHIGRCHPLHGKRKNQYAVDLVHPYRLVFEKYNNHINIVQIDEIVDYH